MVVLRKAFSLTENGACDFIGLSSLQSGGVYASCSTICFPYEVPGGGTPCGTKCMMYCVGR